MPSRARAAARSAVRNRSRSIKEAALLGAVVLGGAVLLGAATKTQSQPSADEVREANNPLSTKKSVNLQDSWSKEIHGTDESANQLYLRAAMPFGRWLTRVTVPVVTSAAAVPESGLGDIQLFATYLIKQEDHFQFGVGPQIVADTASEDALGSGRWQAGLAAVAFYSPSPALQIGGLVTWQTSVDSNDERADTNLLAVQPFALWQLGGGTYLRSTATWVFDLENNTYAIPIGIGIGKVVKSNNLVFNLFVEPQLTVLHKGAGQPELQVFSGINLQF